MSWAMGLRSDRHHTPKYLECLLFSSVFYVLTVDFLHVQNALKDVLKAKLSTTSSRCSHQGWHAFQVRGVQGVFVHGNAGMQQAQQLFVHMHQGSLMDLGHPKTSPVPNTKSKLKTSNFKQFLGTKNRPKTFGSNILSPTNPQLPICQSVFKVPSRSQPFSSNLSSNFAKKPTSYWHLHTPPCCTTRRRPPPPWPDPGFAWSRPKPHGPRDCGRAPPVLGFTEKSMEKMDFSTKKCVSQQKENVDLENGSVNEHWTILCISDNFREGLGGLLTIGFWLFTNQRCRDRLASHLFQDFKHWFCRKTKRNKKKRALLGI